MRNNAEVKPSAVKRRQVQKTGGGDEADRHGGIQRVNVVARGYPPPRPSHRHARNHNTGAITRQCARRSRPGETPGCSRGSWHTRPRPCSSEGSHICRSGSEPVDGVFCVCARGCACTSTNTSHPRAHTLVHMQQHLPPTRPHSLPPSRTHARARVQMHACTHTYAHLAVALAGETHAGEHPVNLARNVHRDKDVPYALELAVDDFLGPQARA